jgi:CheY-like chemotaxis protein
MADVGPIVMIEDDPDDQDTFLIVVQQLKIKNKVMFFESPTLAWKYLQDTIDQPFIIFCDVHLPGESGLDFKKKIDAHPPLKEKSIPFVFYSTSIDAETVATAYKDITVQGFFKKEKGLQDMQNSMKVIFDYWKLSRHPNS